MIDLRDQLVDDVIVVIEGVVCQDERDGSLKMRTNTIASVTDARRQRAQAVVLQLCGDDFSSDFSQRLKQALASDIGGSCPLWVEYRGPSASGRVVLGQSWHIDPSDDCLIRLKQGFGDACVSVRYSDRRAAPAGRPALA